MYAALLNSLQDQAIVLSAAEEFRVCLRGVILTYVFCSESARLLTERRQKEGENQIISSVSILVLCNRTLLARKEQRTIIIYPRIVAHRRVDRRRVEAKGNVLIYKTQCCGSVSVQ